MKKLIFVFLLTLSRVALSQELLGSVFHVTDEEYSAIADECRDSQAFEWFFVIHGHELVLFKSCNSPTYLGLKENWDKSITDRNGEQ